MKKALTMIISLILIAILLAMFLFIYSRLSKTYYDYEKDCSIRNGKCIEKGLCKGKEIRDTVECGKISPEIVCCIQGGSHE